MGSKLRAAASKPELILPYVRRRAKVAYRLLDVSDPRPAAYYLADEIRGSDRLQSHFESKNGARYVDCEVLDFEMVVDLLDAGMSRDLLADGVREPLATRKYREELDRLEAERGGLTVVDVGSNIGYFVLAHLSRSGRGGTAIAIEPNPDSYRLLEENIRHNGFEDAVECHQCAVGAESRRITLQLSTHSNLATVGSHTQGSHYVDEIEVPIRTLDGLLADHGVPYESVDAVRMDLQGFEYEVFRGMTELLAEGDLGLAFLEIHPWYLEEHGEYDAFLTLLEEAGFELSFAADGRTVVLREEKPTYGERELDVASIDDLRDVGFTTEVILRRH